LLFSLIFCIKKDSCGYAKEKVFKKWTSVQVKKRRKGKIIIKIAHVFLQSFKFPKERYILQGAKVELGLATI
jgi:hypothetical protein